jgi:hypothetical protein
MPNAAHFVACVRVYLFREFRFAGFVNSNVQGKRRHRHPVASRPRALPAAEKGQIRAGGLDRNQAAIKHL